MDTSTIYYISNKGHVATKEAWLQWVDDFFAFLPADKPKDSWRRTVKLLQLEEIPAYMVSSVDDLGIKETRGMNFNTGAL